MELELVTAPRGMDGHGSAELGCFSRLQLGIYGVFNDDRRRDVGRLCGVPVGYRPIYLGWQRGFK
jgi:hypothetical protein